MSSSKTWPRDFVAGDYLSESQNLITPPPPYTLYACVYTYSYREGGGEELNQR